MNRKGGWGGAAFGGPGWASGGDSTVPVTDPPTAVYATNVAATENVLAWSGSTPSVTIHRSDDGGDTWGVLTTLSANENIYLDKSCYPSIEYTYKLTAGNSVDSDEVTATTPGPLIDNIPTPTSFVLDSPSPTTVTGSFNQNGATGNRSYMVERRGPDTLAYTVRISAGTGTSFTDVGLSPGTTYWYRVRAISTSQTQSNYCAEVSVTTDSTPVGAPLAPRTVWAETAGPTTIAVSWQDTNGGAAQYEVHGGAYNPAGSPTYSLVATTASGASSYTWSGLTAERPYAVRVRAKMGGQFSDYGSPDPGNGDVYQESMRGMAGAACYACTSSENGGQTYTASDPLTFDWAGLGPGDVVEIPEGEYLVTLMFSCRGTPDRPITVRGLGAGATFNATNAVATQDIVDRPAVWGLGLFHIGPRAGFTTGYTPGHIVLENLVLENAWVGEGSGQYFVDGVARNWHEDSGGVYLERGQDVLISGCESRANANGLFCASQSAFERYIADVRVVNCHIHGNSSTNPAVAFSHNSYLEAFGVVYEGCLYGPIRENGQGINIKDRSSGSTVRYCQIEGGNHQVQFGEAQNSQELAQMTAAYRRSDLYGCVLYRGPGNPESPVWYGGDQGNAQIQRNGILYAYGNTMVSRSDQGQVFKTTNLLSGTSNNLFDARNNVLAVLPVNTATPSDLGVIGSSVSGPTGWAFLGPNWVPDTYFPSTAGDYNFVGHLQNEAALVEGADADPGFVDPTGLNFHPLDDSLPGTTQPGVLPASCQPIAFEFDTDSGIGVVPRVAVCLGALSARPDTVEPRLDEAVVNATGLQLSLVFNEVVTGHTGFTITASGGAASLTYAGGEDSNTLVFTPGRTILDGETITLTYAPGDVEDLPGNPLPAFSDEPVTNDSTRSFFPGPNVQSFSSYDYRTDPGTTQVDLARPTNLADGDGMVAAIYNTGVTTITAPAGWFQMAAVGDIFGDGNLTVYAKEADSEPSTLVFTLGSPVYVAAVLLRLDGQATPYSISEAVEAQGPDSTIQESPAVTTLANDATVIRFLSHARPADSIITIPAGTELVASASTEGVGVGCIVVGAASTLPTAGGSGTAEFLMTAARPTCMVTIGIEVPGTPVPPPPPPPPSPPPPPPPGTGLTEDMVATWRFDEVSGVRADSWGSNDLADPSSTPSAPGILDLAADLDGTTDYFSLEYVGYVSVGDLDFTLAAWVNPSALTAGSNNYILHKLEEYGLLVHDFGAGDPRFAFLINDGDAIVFADLPTPPDLDQWHLVIGWFDAAAETIYIQVNNGVVYSASTSGQNPSATGNPFQVGRYSAGDGLYWNGLIDQTMMWKRILTSEERGELYNEGAGFDPTA